MNADQLAQVSDFVAIPGCGLKCNVSQVETLLTGNTTDVQIMNTRNSTTSFNVTYHIRDDTCDPPAVIEGYFANVLISSDFVVGCTKLSSYKFGLFECVVLSYQMQ